MSSPSRLLSVCTIAGLLLLGGGASAGAGERDLEPVPPMLAFSGSDPDVAARDADAAIIREEVGRTFASLGDVAAGRALLVRRFGLVSAPELARRLTTDGGAYVWNAALTVAALRDTYGPALELSCVLKPLERLLTPRVDDFHTPGFAALAAGSFRWTHTRLPARYTDRRGYYRAVPGTAREAERAARRVAAFRAALLRCVNEKQDFLQIAAMLAAAKMGGEDLRKVFDQGTLPGITNVQPRRALILAHAFLGASTPEPFLVGLRDPDRRVRATAALGLAVSLLIDRRAPWTEDPAPLLKALGGAQIRLHTEEGPETVFARGALAVTRGSGEEWKQIWELATQPSSERELAVAAAQMLLFCDQPWFRAEAVRWARSPRVVLKDPVTALVLLRAGEQGTEQAIDACEKWLRKKSQRPAPDDEWDPRWYAAIGLLRALHAGRIKVKERRVRVVETLRYATNRILDRKAEPRNVLVSLLEQYGDRITGAEETALYRLPQSALQRAEASFRCPCALLSADATDVAVRRVNGMVALIFGLDGLKESTPDEKRTEKQPEKYLKRYLDRYPYLTRLEFFAERGWRPPPALDLERERGIDR